jgi:hypothetical protein
VKTHTALPVSKGLAFHFAYSGMKIGFILSVALLSAMSISSGAYNPFIYFRF